MQQIKQSNMDEEDILTTSTSQKIGIDLPRSMLSKELQETGNSFSR